MDNDTIKKNPAGNPSPSDNSSTDGDSQTAKLSPADFSANTADKSIDWLQQKITEYDKRIESATNELIAVQKELANLFVLKKNIHISEKEETLTEIILKEKELSGIIDEAEKKERESEDMETRRKYEQERWLHTEERSVLEHKKRETEENLQKQKEENEDIQKKLFDLSRKEEYLKMSVQMIELEKEEYLVNFEYQTLLSKRLNQENELQELKMKRESIASALMSEKVNEEDAERKEELIKGDILIAKSRDEEYELEEKRYLLDKERHEIETSRWKLEDEMLSVGKSIFNLEESINKDKTKEEELKEKMEEITLKKYNSGKKEYFKNASEFESEN